MQSWSNPILQIKDHVSLLVGWERVQVYHVLNKMDCVGLDMLLDIHGDEELPYNFINGNEVCLSLQNTVQLKRNEAAVLVQLYCLGMLA